MLNILLVFLYLGFASSFKVLRNWQMLIIIQLYTILFNENSHHRKLYWHITYLYM